MRKLMMLLICIALMITAVPHVLAAGNDDIMPLFQNINTVYANISIHESTGIATCTGMISARQSCPVLVEVKLQRNDGDEWTTLQTWSARGDCIVSCENDYAVYSGYEYRTLVWGYVYDDTGRIIESGSAVHEVNYPKQ